MNPLDAPARRVAVGGLFLALALALPFLFHLLGMGKFFLPMFLPVLTLGFLADWKTASLVGALAPLASSLLTGMPPIVPTAFLMTMELALLGGLASLLYNRFRWGLWPSLITTIAAVQAAGFVLHFLLAELFLIPGVIYGLVSFVSTLPGIALQLVVVPLAVTGIEARFGPYWCGKGEEAGQDFHEKREGNDR